MWEIIGATVALLLALYGVADLLLRIVWRLFFTGTHEVLTLVVSAGEDAEYRIRRLAMWMHLCPRGAFVPTVVLSEENELLKRMCERLGLICKTALHQPENTL